uniref:C-type lectin domain-containing protein n=1 Tax=Panagrolaimus sp. ES5 TaxID=591445 RepID=A0AC34FL74_9BILA
MEQCIIIVGFRWSDKTEIDYYNWFTDQPGNHAGNERMVQFKTDEKFLGWGDQISGFKYHEYLCKMPAELKNPVKLPPPPSIAVDGKKCRKDEKRTINNSKCPDKNYYMLEIPYGTYCYRKQTTSADTNIQDWIQNKICSVLHPNLTATCPQSFDEIDFYSYMTDTPFQIGMYIPEGKPYAKNSYRCVDGSSPKLQPWHSAEPLQPQNGPHQVVYVGTHSLYHSSKSIDTFRMIPNLMCRMKAEPLLPCAPLPYIDACAKLEDYKCPDGWAKYKTCGKVQCYRAISVATHNRNLEALKENICDKHFKNSKTITVHCEEENDFLQRFGVFALGLYVPADEIPERNNWKWYDGSPVDFVAWELFHSHKKQAPYNEAPNHRIAYYRHTDQNRFGWVDGGENFDKIVCKMDAIKLETAKSCPSSEEEVVLTEAPTGAAEPMPSTMPCEEDETTKKPPRKSCSV